MDTHQYQILRNFRQLFYLLEERAEYVHTDIFVGLHFFDRLHQLGHCCRVVRCERVAFDVGVRALHDSLNHEHVLLLGNFFGQRSFNWFRDRGESGRSGVHCRVQRLGGNATGNERVAGCLGHERCLRIKYGHIRVEALGWSVGGLELRSSGRHGHRADDFVFCLAHLEVGLLLHRTTQSESVGWS